MNEDQERAAFEAWHLRTHSTRPERYDGPNDYSNANVRNRWIGWKIRASMSREDIKRLESTAKETS